MKRAVLFMVVLFSLVSCSKDDNDTTATHGQYLAETGEMLFSMQLADGKCRCFTVFDGGSYFSQTLDVSTSGSYPDYEFTAGGLRIKAKFTSADSFNASLSGGASSVEGTHWIIDGVLPITFKLDNTVLDANGDGILDSKK